MAADNKTEQATPRRRQKAREKGQVARSRELVASLATLAGVLLLWTQPSGFGGIWRGLLRRSLEAPGSFAEVSFSVREAGLLFRPVVITLALVWMVATVAGVGQGGLVLAPSSLQPTWSRLSPSSKLQQLFSLTAVSRLLKSLLPAAAVVYVGVAILARDWRDFPVVLSWSLPAVVTRLRREAFELSWKCALILVVWAFFDYLLERRKFESDLRMSRQDLLDEFKETEGNPSVKARIRRLQRQIRRQ
jgi:flagellar biosynthesis protein FlhB